MSTKREWTLGNPSNGASGSTASAYTAWNVGDSKNYISCVAKDTLAIQTKNTGTGWISYAIQKANDKAFTIPVSAGSATLASGVTSGYTESPALYAYYRLVGYMDAASASTYAVYVSAKG